VRFGQHGRLGNQLFQYSMMKSVSLKNRYTLKLPNIKNSDLKYFDVSCQELKQEDLKHVSKTFVDEPQFHFRPEVFEQPDFTNFHGYYQSEDYFKEFEEQIRKDLTFKKYIIDSAQYEIEKYRNSKPLVSVHVRRGDYLTIHDGLFHTPCNLKYYRQAMEMFPNVDFLFFSDDVGWCKENFKAKNIKYSDSNNSMVDFAMITLCDHHILANSSFSWWSAWLNNNNKKVVAPANWFGPVGPQDTYDLIPDEWNII
tara:strand:+ start:2823 stop:3584 length:762 start_codon:yes stop_codon:yes gene_type:complete